MLRQGTLEADSLKQQGISEMLLDVWLKACLQRICSDVLASFRICLVL